MLDPPVKCSKTSQDARMLAQRQSYESQENHETFAELSGELRTTLAISYRLCLSYQDKTVTQGTIPNVNYVAHEPFVL